MDPRVEVTTAVGHKDCCMQVVKCELKVLCFDEIQCQRFPHACGCEALEVDE